MSSVQYVRLADVFIIGPIIIYAATRKELAMNLRVALMIIGIGTIVYNGYNFLKNN